MFRRLFSYLFILFIVTSSAVLFFVAFAIWLVTVFFDKKLIILHRFSSFWASIYLWLMPAWRVKKYGREKIQSSSTYMVVSNHQSQLDILVAFNMFFHFKWVSKAEIFKLPFIGWNMFLNRYIRLVRGDRRSIEQMLEDCEKTLIEGNSVYIFPEGTRSENGELRPFKPGAFHLAKKMEIPILPIVINGTKDALPKKSMNFTGIHDITIEILNEIPYSVFAEKSVEDTAVMVREIINDKVVSD